MVARWAAFLRNIRRRTIKCETAQLARGSCGCQPASRAYQAAPERVRMLRSI